MPTNCSTVLLSVQSWPCILFPMPFVCSVCSENFRSQGGLTKHVNSKHSKNSTLAGMASASQAHTFIRHPYLSGMSKLICGFSFKVLNTYELSHVHLMAHSSRILSHNF